MVILNRFSHLLAAFCLTLVMLSFPGRETLGADQVIYDNSLQNGWQDWSWAMHSLSCTAPVHSAALSISMIPAGWEALYLHLAGSVSGSEYRALDFWIHGGTAGGQNLRVVFLLSGNPLVNRPLTDFLPGGPLANSWSEVSISLDSIGLGSSTFSEICIQDGSGNSQAAVYLDDFILIERPGGGGPVTVSVEPDLDRHPVNPHIFGAYLVDTTTPSQGIYTVRRWGGNHTTRYNWIYDTSNRASDWYYLNVPYGNSPGNKADLFIDDARLRGAEPLLTVPLIGWTPADDESRWGFSIAEYGPQQENECTRGEPPWCNSDAGNGVRTDGTDVTGNDPYDTSVPIGPTFVTQWMQHIASRVGTAAEGGLKFYALDNEVALWNSTHRDVHPNPVDYAELWQRTESYASAIKAQDPGAVTFGPVAWGWCEYFYSASDGCGPGPDYNANGPLLEWYLAQVESYRAAHETRLVDYLDIHYYPQASGVYSEDESAAVQSARLRSLKSLYDPSYTDESWIGQAVRLIPRMKEIIAARAPWAKLAITEYNFGDADDGISSAMAQAETLGIFAREGVDLASRWVAPGPDTLVEDAFRLYLDYDGAGAKVQGDSVRATSSDVDEVGAYAVRRADNRLYLLLFNKSTSARSVPVVLNGSFAGNLSLFGFDATNRLGAAGTITPSGGNFTIDLPARSARLAVGQLLCPLPGEASGLKLGKNVTEFLLTWENLASATSYAVYEDMNPSGEFATLSGTATSGTTGLPLPLSGDLRYYLVAAQNGCGEGIKK